MFIFIVIQLSFFSAALANSVVIKNCTTATPNFWITKLNIDQLPIKIGSNVTIDFDAKSLIKVEEGTTVEVSVTYAFITFSCENYEKFCFNVCQIVKEGAVTCLINGNPCQQCPISPGSIQVEHLIVETPHTFVLPGAEVTVTIKAYDKSRNLIACVEADKVPVIN